MRLVRSSVYLPSVRSFQIMVSNILPGKLLGLRGTGTVLGIRLPYYPEKVLQMSKRAFQGMNHLQFLHLSSDDTLCLPAEGLNCFPDKLRLLDWRRCPLRIWPSKFSGKFLVELIMPHSNFEKLWDGIKVKIFCIYWRRCPLRIWPSKFSGKFLVELIMPHSNFEKLWDGIKPLPCLKRMDLSKSSHLNEIPDLSKATSLEILNLSHCRSLLELPSSIGRLISVEELDLRRFSSVEELSDCSGLLDLSYSGIGALELPLSIRTWSCFYRLDMSGLSDLKKFPNVPYSIKTLELSNTGIEEIPPCIENLYCLEELTMWKCKNLEIVSPNISKLANLETIQLCKGGGETFTAMIKLIQTSACEYALLPGEEVPAHFTHQAISSSLTIDLTPRHLPSSFRFKACVLLSELCGYLNVSCCVRGKQNGLTAPYGSTQLRYMPYLYSSRNHLYIFEDYVSLSQDCPEAKDPTFSELSFLFTVDEALVVEGCGVRILEWSPNHLVDELIAQWCQANKYDWPEASDAPIGLFSDDIDLLLQRISSPSSVEDQTKAENELRPQTKRLDNVPALFVAKIHASISQLLTPLSALGEAIDSNPGLQKDIITALLYISSFEENKNSKTLKALVHVIKEDHFTAAISASYAVFQHCYLPENSGKVVSEVKPSERIAGGSNKLKSKFSHRRYYPDSFDPEPLKDPPQTSASSGTGNDKIRYRSPPSTELMESEQPRFDIDAGTSGIWIEIRIFFLLGMNLSSSCRPSIRTLTFTGKISKTSTTSLVGSQLTSSSLALTKRSQERRTRSVSMKAIELLHSWDYTE
ncbi:hypothetical protein F2Q69_00000763 [Brassica cretica]|uniref:C-JID domain-containing protein n=1 Tax=Brassica cretica TaxID=69181 RepID=A0A8S9P0T8_BRACR|nr:hypothetical protein F2Q69_00000763 [Brassica cretica]